ncbi:hypothetical protein [Saccharothrix obliqua]|uniref:hypothetical protein n=1 Tax=Saccharothrix obliqua TaxID=2861747 RepID=UPI001C5DF6DB|nr:hypothetical protein [Saccharothrix obliqua]MBW4717601.1 hypothetical protein [Saccharothrix obliqua]
MTDGETQSLHVRVPVEVVASLRTRPKSAGMSLTDYVSAIVTEAANKPTMSEWVESATDRSRGVEGEALRTTREEAVR